MKRAAMMCASLCAALAVPCAVAQATPGSLEFGKCSAHAGGRFANSGCTKLAKTPESQKFEWAPLSAGVASAGAKERETGEVVFESAGGSKITCAGFSQREGEFGAASKEENVVWVFTSCKSFAECNTEGAKAGELVWNELRGVPGIVQAEPKEEKDVVGIAFSPKSAPNDAEFNCGPAPEVVRGGVITKMQADSTGGTAGELTNKMLNKFELEFVAANGGKQVPEKLEGGPVENLESSLAEATFEQTSLTMTYAQLTSPKTTKVELRKCEANAC